MSWSCIYRASIGNAVAPFSGDLWNCVWCIFAGGAVRVSGQATPPRAETQSLPHIQSSTSTFGKTNLKEYYGWNHLEHFGNQPTNIDRDKPRYLVAIRPFSPFPEILGILTLPPYFWTKTCVGNLFFKGFPKLFWLLPLWLYLMPPVIVVGVPNIDILTVLASYQSAVRVTE